MRILLVMLLLGWAVDASAAEGFKESAPGKPVCEIDSHEDFLQMDHNLDGKVTLQEVKDIPFYAEATDEEKAQLQDMRYQMFHMMDQNGDEVVTRDELKAFTVRTMPDCIVK